MWTALVTLVPVGLALALLMFGRYGTRRRPPAPTAGRIAPVAAAAVLLGPAAAAVLGFVGWLVLVAVVVGATLTAAMLRAPRLRHR